MKARAFLELARELTGGATESHWRGAVGRAYYGLMLECRDALLRWGFVLPPRDRVHAVVRLRMVYSSDKDVKRIGFTLDHLGQLRNRADYDLTSSRYFASVGHARQAVQDATDALALLDAVENDPGHLAAAIASIQP
jgi:hypothetical protein